MRYIIALLAINQNLFIEEAQKEFGHISQDYLLSQNSLPHITLASFDLDDNNQNVIENIWQEIQSQIDILPKIRFLGFGLSRKLKIFWNVSLTVARDPELVKLHNQVIEILKNNNLKCISEVGDLYRPHLTLARIKELNMTNFNDKLLEPAEFVLAMGEGDIHGQFLKVIFKK